MGAYLEDATASNSGAAYIFQRNEGGTDNWGEVKRLVSSDNGLRDRFGWSVTIDTDTIVVGAYQADDACPSSTSCNSGAVYVFYRDFGGAGNWGEFKKITASDLTMGDRFGRFVSLDGDTLAIAAPFNDINGGDSGKVYILERNAGGADNWGEIKIIDPADGSTGDRFGESIDLDQDTLAVGAWYSDAKGADSGAAYVF